MCLLLHLVISLYLHRKIDAKIIGDAIRISVGIQNPLRSSIRIPANRKSYWPARTVRDICRNAKAMRQFQIANKTYIVRLIVIAGIVLAMIDNLALKWIVHLQ